MAKQLLATILMMVSIPSFADSRNVNRESIVNKSYICSNGGSIQLLGTRYGNVKKVVFSKTGSLNQIGYVSFRKMTDHYEGTISTYMTFPDPASSEEPIRSNDYAEMGINFDGQGLVMTIVPIRINEGQEFSCKNY